MFQMRQRWDMVCEPALSEEAVSVDRCISYSFRGRHSTIAITLNLVLFMVLALPLALVNDVFAHIIVLSKAGYSPFIIMPCPPCGFMRLSLGKRRRSEKLGTLLPQP